MTHIKLSPAWIQQIDQTLLPWMQGQLQPINESNEELDITDAHRVDLYFGEDKINLHLQPGVFADFVRERLVELQFCATQVLDQLPKVLQASLASFPDRYASEHESLFNFHEAATKSDIPLDFLKDGILRGTLFGDRMFLWDWDNGKVDEEGWCSDRHIGVQVYPDGIILLFDGEEGDLIAPEIKVTTPKELPEVLTQLEKALSKETGKEEAVRILEKLFSTEDKEALK